MKSIYNLDTNYYNIYVKRARKGGSKLDYNLGQFSITIHIEAYVTFIHYIEKVYQIASRQGGRHEEPAMEEHHEH